MTNTEPLGRWIEAADVRALGERAIIVSVEIEDDEPDFVSEDIFESHFGPFTHWQPEERGDPRQFAAEDLGAWALHRNQRLLAIWSDDIRGRELTADELRELKPGQGALLHFERTGNGPYLSYDTYMWFGGARAWGPVDGNAADEESLSPAEAAGLIGEMGASMFTAHLIYTRTSLPPV